MGLMFLFGLFFVIIFAAIVELFFRCPYAVAALVAIISLIVYAFLSATLTTIFIVWIIIYTLTALLTAFLTSRFLGRNGRCDKGNENCDRCGRQDF